MSWHTKGIEMTSALVQLIKPRFAPTEVVRLFVSRRQKVLFGLAIFRRERLPVVERLSADLATMIDAH